MAKNASFKNFQSFSKTINSTVLTDAAFNTDQLIADMTSEHAEFTAEKTAYEAWAGSTLLADSVSPVTGLKFSDLFAMEVGDMGQNVVVFNPTGKNGSSWSKNESGMVNALLTAFGTQRYSDLRHGLHDRKFDRSLVIEHNVRSAYDPIACKWVRYNWNNRRFTADTPYIKTPQGAGWLSKHVEIDRMLLALLGNQQIRYNFFQEIAWKRFETNVLDNMQSLVSKVNLQLANQAEMSQTLDKIDRKNVIEGHYSNGITPTSVIVDGVDLKKLTENVVVEVKMRYASNPVKKTINPQNPVSIAFVTGTMADRDCEYIKLVK